MQTLFPSYGNLSNQKLEEEYSSRIMVYKLGVRMLTRLSVDLAILTVACSTKVVGGESDVDV